MGKPVPERQAAKAAGERFYDTGKPCKNGHLSKRYTGTGVCATCAVKNTRRHQMAASWDPARQAAKDAGRRHYAAGFTCVNGHEDKRYVANGHCFGCQAARQRRYAEAHPGQEARWARERRAKDPSGHRAEAKRWYESNREKAREAARRWTAANIDYVRRTRIVIANRRRARIADNGGTFTIEDVERLYRAQRNCCAACLAPSMQLEIDHIMPIRLGGGSDPSNLQLLCLPCNRSKGGKHPSTWKPRQSYDTTDSVLTS